MKSSINRYISLAACIAALFFMVVAPARAAYIVGSFDPKFGDGFTNLSWSGEIELYVPDKCLKDKLNFLDKFWCGLNSKTTHAEVVLKNTSNGKIATIDDFGSSWLLGARPYLGQVRIEKGLVTGFSTWGNCFFGCLSVGGFRSPGADSLGSGYDLFSYGLSFRLNDPSVPTDPSVFLYADIFATDVKAGSDVEKILFQDGSDDAGFQKGELYGNCKSRANGHYYECVSGQTKETLAVYTKFEQLTDAEYEARQMNVPEPGSLALMFSALGAAAWVRRRKASTR